MWPEFVNSRHQHLGLSRPRSRPVRKYINVFLAIDSINAEKWSHEKIVAEIIKAKNDFSLTVIDERSDDARLKNRPFMFRIMKGKGGYGFYMWNDTDGKL